MNVIVEEKPNCQVELRVEVPGVETEKTRAKILADYQKGARLPGFRPGKAPLQLIESKYAKELRDALVSTQVDEALRQASKEKNLPILLVNEVSEVDLGADFTLRFKALAVVEPTFELPDYNNLEIPVAEPKVTDEDVDSAMERFRLPHASYTRVEERGLQNGDFAVLSYRSTLDGVSLGEVLPSAPPLLKERKNMWLEIGEQQFLPGFAEQVVGMTPETTRAVHIVIPQDGPPDLVGKTLDFDVTLHEINTQELPDWNDELAGKIFEGKTLAELREHVRERLMELAKNQYESAKRNAVVDALARQVTCELPVHVVNTEMRSILRDIVNENQSRGMDPQELAAQEEQILGMARHSAENNTRARYLLLRIAEKEELRVNDQQFLMHILELSERMQTPPKKLLADLRKRDAIHGIREDLVVAKALDFLLGKAKFVEPVAAS